MPTIVSINLSPGGIPKQPVKTIEITVDGLVGDGHDHEKHNTPLQAVSIIDVEDLDDLRAEGYDVTPGATGENLTVRDLDADSLRIGDRLHAGSVQMEITKIRRPCYVLDAIDKTLKTAIVDRCGCYARVLEPGRVSVGDEIRIERSTA